MKDAGLEVVGTVTDGEFNSLRTQGESGPLHIWQLVHDAKEAVRKMSKTTLQSMLTYAGEDANGIPFSTTPNSAIPTDLIGKLHELQNGGLSFEDAIVNIRGSLVPEGYTPYPFRKDTPESFLDKMRSIVATFIYKDAIKTLKQEGRDFTQHLYVPEKDSVTGKDHHERGDHNHLLKRIAGCTRECRYEELNPEAFDKAMIH
ncbi:uncharacterized protein LOC134231906 [Saccostrea cucullata]|uniref:uncharacterized protein LOC134231906 n=1 Tax=Saccostrea cuccullata TaxID=36930 RepID=UPI002ED5B415